MIELKVRMKLSSSLVSNVIQHLESTILPMMYVNNKKGTYAKGRNEIWLNVHTPLTQWDENPGLWIKNPTAKGKFVPGHSDERLWTFCQKVCEKAGNFTPNTGLIVYGEKGITLHKDASSLSPEGVTINLGDTNFLYADSTQNSSKIQAYTLNKGDVITFNSKHRHAVPQPKPGRWAIILWRVQTRTQEWVRKEFDEFKSKYPHINTYPQLRRPNV